MNQTGCFSCNYRSVFTALLIFVALSANIAQAVGISGTLKFPEGVVTTQDTRFQIWVFNEVPGVSQGSAFTSIIVPSGSTEFDYDFQNLIENEGDNVIRYVCICNDSFINKGFFGDSGVVYSKQEARKFSANQNHSNIELNIEIGIEVKLTVLLPDGVPTPSEEPLRVALLLNEEETFRKEEENLLIDIGERSASHTFRGLHPSADLPLTASYWCPGGCPSFLPRGYYTGAKVAPAIEFADRLSSLQNWDISIAMVAERSISGKTLLPDDYGINGSHRVFYKLEVTNFDWTYEDGSHYTQYLGVSELLPPGAREISYTVGQIFPGSGEIRVQYQCSNGCDDIYYRDVYYSLNQSVLLPEDATLLSPSQNHQQINFNLIRRNEITGTISTADGQPVQAEISFTVKATVYSRLDQDYRGIFTRTASIEAGETEAGYSIPGLPVFGVDYYMLVSFSASAIGYYTEGFYASSGTNDTVVGATELSAAMNLSGIDMQIRKTVVHSISGVIALPASMIADQNLSVNVRLHPFLGSDASDLLLIEAGESEVAFNFEGLSYPVPTTYKIYYEISQESEYVSSGYYSELGTVRDISLATELLAEMDHSNVRLELLIGNEVFGDVTLQGNFSLQDEVGGSVVIETFSADHIQTDRKTTPFQIAQNGGSSTYTIEGLWIEPDGYYTVSYNCSLNCRLYLGSAWVGEEGMVENYAERKLLSSLGNPAEVDLVILEGNTNVVSGYIKWPEDYDETEEISFIVTFDVSPSEGQGGALERSSQILRIPENSNQIPFSHRLRTPDSGGVLEVYYRCLICPGAVAGPYYYVDENEHSFDSGEITQLIAAQDHNLTLGVSRGTVFSGIFGFDSSIQRTGNVTVDIVVLTFNESGQEVNVDRKRHELGELESSLRFSLGGIERESDYYYIVRADAHWLIDTSSESLISYFSGVGSTNQLSGAKRFDATTYEHHEGINFGVTESSIIIDDQICFPVKSKQSNLAVICL